LYRGEILLQLVDTSSLNNVSALLTSACVSSTYEVETTKDIVQMWDKIRKSIKIKGDIEFISAIMSTGRIMHGNTEMKDPDRIMEIVDTFKKEIMRKTEDLTFGQKEYCSAYLTSACVSHSKKIISAKDIVNLWDDIRNNIKISNDADIISIVLTAGRVVDIKCQSEGYLAIGDSFQNVQTEVNNKTGDIGISRREVASAYVAAACIEITPKVEKIRDMIAAWLQINEQMPVKNESEYIAALLTAGRIKDLNAQHFMIPQSITDIHSKILEYINEIE
jgi:Tfp pilus assembly protein PilX